MKVFDKFLLTLLLLPALTFGRAAAADIATETRFGDVAFQAGDFVNAARFYGNALALAGDDREIWPDLALKLGAAKLHSGDIAGARQMLNEYRTRFPARSAGVLPAEVLLAEEKLAEAAKFLELVIANAADPNLACQAEFLLACVRIREKNYADAVSGFEQLERENADLPEWAERSHLAAIYTLLLAGEFQEADELLARGKYRASAPDRYRELELLSKLSQGGSFEEFERAWAELPAERHEQPDMIRAEIALAGAEAAERAGEKRKAAELLHEAARLAVGDGLRRSALRLQINLLAEIDPAAAAAAIRRYDRLCPGEPDRFALRMRAGRLLAAAKEYRESLSLYRTLLADSDLPAALRFEAVREAAAAAELGGDAKAAEALFRSLPSEADSEARRNEGTFLLGEYLLRQKAFEEAAAEFRRIPAGGERGDDARRRLLETLMSLHQYADAIPVAEELRASRRPEYAVTADYTLALLREKSGQRIPARSAYLKFLAAYPESEFREPARYRAAALAFCGGEFEAAGREFADFAREFPDSSLAPAALYQAVQAADFARDAKLTAEALETLERRFPKSEAAVGARLQLAENRLAENAWSEAEKLLENTAGDTPDNAAEILYDRARIAVGRGETRQADSLLAELLGSYVSSAIAADAAMLRGNLAVNRGDVAAALTHFLRAAELRPGGIFSEVCAGRIADCRYARYSETLEPADLAAARDAYAKLAEEAGSEQLRLQSLCKLGKCEELSGEAEKAAAAYDRALYLALDLHRRAIPPDPAWSAKAAYGGARLALRDDTAQGAENALRILTLFAELKLSGTDELDRLREELRNKYNLQEKK